MELLLVSLRTSLALIISIFCILEDNSALETWEGKTLLLLVIFSLNWLTSRGMPFLKKEIDCFMVDFRHIFHPEDDALLKYLDDDGLSIEPHWYMPVVPLVLINGAEGIGTGWSTHVPNYNPRDVINNLKLILTGAEPKPMHPWYRVCGVFQPLECTYKSVMLTSPHKNPNVDISILKISLFFRDLRAPWSPSQINLHMQLQDELSSSL